jgi:hypothetical protein
MTQVWTKERVYTLLDQSDAAVVRALQQIYSRQTESERCSLATVASNGVGFNAHDAKILSDIARRLPYYNNKMTPRQMTMVRRMIKKYWRQLLDIIAENGGEVSYSANSLKHEIAEVQATAEVEMTPQDLVAAAYKNLNDQYGLF